nr:hypothetical protein [Tanacetum cinerariifolium]
MGTFRETLVECDEGAPHLGPKQPRVYSDLSPKEKERVVVSNVQGRQNRGHGNNAMGTGVAGYGGAQNRDDNVVDDDVDEQPVQDLALNVDNMFQADKCDVFDFDVDEAPTAQTMFMENLSFVDPVYDEADPSIIRSKRYVFKHISTPEQIFSSKALIKMKAEALKEQTPATRPIKALTVYPPNTPAMLVPGCFQQKVK